MSLGLYLGIGSVAGAFVAISLGILLFMMNKNAKKNSNLVSEPKESQRQWYKFDDMTPSSTTNDSNQTPQASSDSIPELVIEK